MRSASYYSIRDGSGSCLLVCSPWRLCNGPSTALKLFPKSNGILVTHIPACFQKRRMSCGHVFEVINNHQNILCATTRTRINMEPDWLAFTCNSQPTFHLTRSQHAKATGGPLYSRTHAYFHSLRSSAQLRSLVTTWTFMGCFFSPWERCCHKLCIKHTWWRPYPHLPPGKCGECWVALIFNLNDWLTRPQDLVVGLTCQAFIVHDYPHYSLHIQECGSW